ncbi:MAG: hypothetical protein ABI681_10760 [Gemmatimonadales bacterium]
MAIVRRHLPLSIAFLAMAACSSKDSPPAEGTPVPPPPAPSASAPAGDPTAADISRYELTMDKMRRWTGAMKEMAKAEGANAQAVEGINMGTDPLALSVSKMEATPVVKNALDKAGLSARDYLMIMSAYLQAGMTDAMLKANPQAKVPEGQSTKNVEFVRAHRAELEQLMKDAGMTQ